MYNLAPHWQTLQRTLGRSARRADERPAQVPIAPDHTDLPPAADTRLLPRQHYFRVEISELSLLYRRGWFASHDPLLLLVSEFTYADTTVTLPVVAGPAALSQQLRKTVGGMAAQAIRAAGWHPYQGGPLHLTVVLCRLRRDPAVQPVLRLIEHTARAVDSATHLQAYLQIAGVLLHGIDELLRSSSLTPVLGARSSLEPAADGSLPAGYTALIDMPEEKLFPAALWVRNGRLGYGPTRTTAPPFTQADSVLCRVACTSQRDDIQALPCYHQFAQFRDTIRQAMYNNRHQARAALWACHESLTRSPDLVPAQASDLWNGCAAELQRALQRAPLITAVNQVIQQRQTEDPPAPQNP